MSQSLNLKMDDIILIIFHSDQTIFQYEPQSTLIVERSDFVGYACSLWLYPAPQQSVIAYCQNSTRQCS